jgi:hypothetical protein
MEIDIPLHAKLLDMCQRPEYAVVVVGNADFILVRCPIRTSAGTLAFLAEDFLSFFFNQFLQTDRKRDSSTNWVRLALFQILLSS